MCLFVLMFKELPRMPEVRIAVARCPKEIQTQDVVFFGLMFFVIQPSLERIAKPHMVWRLRTVSRLYYIYSLTS